MIPTIALNPYMTLATWVDCEREEFYDLQYRPAQVALPDIVGTADVAQCDEALSELYSSSARVKYALFWFFKPVADTLDHTSREEFCLINRSTLAIIADQPELAVESMMHFLADEQRCSAFTQVLGVTTKWTSARLWHIYFSEVANHWGVERIAKAVLALKDVVSLRYLVAQTTQLVASALHKECVKAEFVYGERVEIYYNTSIALIGCCRTYLDLLREFGDETMCAHAARLASESIVKCAERYRAKCDELNCEDKSDEMFAYARTLCSVERHSKSVVADVEEIYYAEPQKERSKASSIIIFVVVVVIISTLCALLMLI